MELNTIQSLSCKVEKGATGIHYFKGDETAEVTTADRELMAKIREFARQKKGIIIDQEPCKDNGGFMLALVPVELIFSEQKRPKITRNISPEQRQKLSERMKKINKQRKEIS